MSFALFLALKYLRPKRSFVSVVTLVSVLGVLLGVAILVIVLSVMTGFDDTWREKILSFNAHLTVLPVQGAIEEADSLAEGIARLPGISAAAPYVQTLVLMQHRGYVGAPVVVGMEPRHLAAVSSVPAGIRAGSFRIDNEHVLVGKDLAAEFGLRVGDRPLIHSPQNVRARDEIYLPEEPEVAGVFEVGMWEYDSRFVLASMELARDLVGLRAGAHAVRVMTEDPFRAGEYAQTVAALIGPAYSVRTWMDLNRTLFDALRVEKTVMFVLLVFISIVAVFCVTNTLIVITVSKTNEIGLLKALGFSPAQIMGVFICHGWIQCLVGTLLGIGAGLLVLHRMNVVLHWLSDSFDFEIFPKSIYQLSEIPWHTCFRDVASVAGLVMLLCTAASILPAWYAARLNPAEALRHE